MLIQDMATPRPGPSEYLASLLVPPDYSCPHDNKMKSREIPARLGFFRDADGLITYIETGKLCQTCYDLAVPNGFNVWSTYYKPFAQPMPPELKEQFSSRMMDSEEWSQYYGQNATLTRTPHSGWAALRVPFNDDYYPPMIQAGTESNPDHEVQRLRMPVNAEAHETFRYLRELGQPYYIDQLHLVPPWNPKAPNQIEEDRRVARENYIAYKSAAHGLVGTGVGGAGKNSIVEQRILGGRAIQIPGYFGASNVRIEHDYQDTTPRGATPGPVKVFFTFLQC
ncbi:hypothetical protein F4809DRAFT_604217 [Biscogniauxia mediterranea]|nr:hypothetical protein F4809DRAFT_604217 [Biscogniauxia mediterranea]